MLLVLAGSLSITCNRQRIGTDGLTITHTHTCLSEIGSIECESTSSDHQVLEDNIIYYPLKNSSKIGKISEIIEAKVAYYN